MLNVISRHRFQDMSQLVWLERKLREGFQKQKYKFKMAFAMKGGGLACPKRILKNDFYKSIQNHSLTVKMCFAHILGFILAVLRCIVYQESALLQKNSLINPSILEFKQKSCLNLTKSKKQNHPQPGRIHNLHRKVQIRSGGLTSFVK